MYTVNLKLNSPYITSPQSCFVVTLSCESSNPPPAPICCSPPSSPSKSPSTVPIPPSTSPPYFPTLLSPPSVLTAGQQLISGPVSVCFLFLRSVPTSTCRTVELPKEMCCGSRYCPCSGLEQFRGCHVMCDVLSRRDNHVMGTVQVSSCDG